MNQFYANFYVLGFDFFSSFTYQLRFYSVLHLCRGNGQHPVDHDAANYYPPNTQYLEKQRKSTLNRGTLYLSMCANKKEIKLKKLQFLKI